MKKIISNIYLVIAFIAAMGIQIHVMIIAAGKNDKITLPQSLVEAANTENELLSTIIENAAVLVSQMTNNKHHENDRKMALKTIDVSLKKLSTTTKQHIESYINTIKEASTSFITVKKPLKKYNSAAAQIALNELINTTQRLSENRTEDIITEVQQKLIGSINNTETIKKEANIKINKARELLSQGVITSVEAAKIIGEQNYKIGAAERALKKETREAQNTVTQSDAQTSYLNQLTTGMYAIGARAVAPFKAGYGYTQEEKNIARAIIKQLELQLKDETDPLTTQLIDNEIHKQQLITGDVMSANRRLFWGTVAVAGALAAGLWGYNRFMGSTEVPNIAPQPQTPATSATLDEKIEEPANQQSSFITSPSDSETKNRPNEQPKEKQNPVIVEQSEQQPLQQNHNGDMDKDGEGPSSSPAIQSEKILTEEYIEAIAAAQLAELDKQVADEKAKKEFERLEQERIAAKQAETDRLLREQIAAKQAEADKLAEEAARLEAKAKEDEDAAARLQAKQEEEQRKQQEKQQRIETEEIARLAAAKKLQEEQERKQQEKQKAPNSTLLIAKGEVTPEGKEAGEKWEATIESVQPIWMI